MQLYALSYDPVECVRALDDIRLRAAVKESGQIISTALAEHGCSIPELYTPAFVNHPVVKWTMRDLGNLEWTRRYLINCAEEYRWRFGKQHKTADRLVRVWSIKIYTDWLPFRPGHFCNAASRLDKGFDFRNMSTFDGYKTYLAVRWQNDDRKPVWTSREVPEWSGLKEFT